LIAASRRRRLRFFTIIFTLRCAALCRDIAFAIYFMIRCAALPLLFHFVIYPSRYDACFSIDYAISIAGASMMRGTKNTRQMPVRHTATHYAILPPLPPPPLMIFIVVAAGTQHISLFSRPLLICHLFHLHYFIIDPL